MWNTSQAKSKLKENLATDSVPSLEGRDRDERLMFSLVKVDAQATFQKLKQKSLQTPSLKGSIPNTRSELEQRLGDTI